MSRPWTSRLAARTHTLLLRPSRPLAPQCTALRLRDGAQSFSHSSTRWDEQKGDGRPKRVPARPRTESLLENIYGASQPARGRPTPQQQQQQPNAMSDLSQSMVFQALNKSNIDTSALSGRPSEAVQPRDDELEPYHFHIHSHKHNTHITCTKPNREPIISMSCGNIGFRKSRRGTFDSAYSLTKYVLERLIHTGWPMKIKRIELVLRGFGQGREAAVKVLMSPEGKVFRDKIVRVADSTRIKFGGTRSEKPRRL
ncbi:hypothetical protein Purlil1_8013 [Purpureocillium lilacinum]|uniref:37S ribosomal protein S11 n=1 Tax=Purpureocillium lilacinum TaxID=33203 RepID=A0ABR0BUL2_PURLI|nr:hypothetical protein Purlil1_8013 [Purpureocillium lilacinum]